MFLILNWTLVSENGQQYRPSFFMCEGLWVSETDPAEWEMSGISVS